MTTTSDNLELKPNHIYQHYKGGLYRLLAIAKHEKDGVKDTAFCVYLSLENGETRMCPVDEFRHKFAAYAPDQGESIHDLVLEDLKQYKLRWELKPVFLYSRLLDVSQQIAKLMQVDLLVELEKRKQKGIETYGVPLSPHNGRDALQDAFEEILDAVCYLKQYLEENKGLES